VCTGTKEQANKGAKRQHQEPLAPGVNQEPENQGDDSSSESLALLTIKDITMKCTNGTILFRRTA
jgi:hypothetical protein